MDENKQMIEKTDGRPRDAECPPLPNANNLSTLAELQNWVKTTGQPMASAAATDAGTGEKIYAGLIETFNRRLQDAVKAMHAVPEVASGEGKRMRQSMGNNADTNMCAADLADTADAANVAAVRRDLANLNEKEIEAVNSFVDKYYVDRRGTDCRKWDDLAATYGTTDLLPLWIADMDFAFEPSFADRLSDRVRHGALGYPVVSASYYDTVGKWLEEHYGYKPWPEWFLFSPGVVSGLSWIIQALTEPQDSIAVFTPVYPPIRKVAAMDGRKKVEFELECDAAGRFTFDPIKLEKEWREAAPKAIIICSPHNPIGRIWQEDELRVILQLAVKYDCLVIADEIHQDIVMPGHKQKSILAIDDGRYADRICVAHSISKTFNMAGLAHSNIIIPNSRLRDKVSEVREKCCHGGLNVLSLLGTEYAYEVGQPWLDKLLLTVRYNYLQLRKLANTLRNIRLAPLEGTYLSFMDLGAYLPLISAAKNVEMHDAMADLVENKCHLAVNYGDSFGEAYGTWIRINLATSPANIAEACERLKQVLSIDGAPKKRQN